MKIQQITVIYYHDGIFGFLFLKLWLESPEYVFINDWTIYPRYKDGIVKEAEAHE